MPDSVVIIIRSEQKAFYASIGFLLAQHLPVTFIVDSRDAATVIRNIFAPDSAPTIHIEPDFRLTPEERWPRKSEQP